MHVGISSGTAHSPPPLPPPPQDTPAVGHSELLIAPQVPTSWSPGLCLLYAVVAFVRILLHPPAELLLIP